MNKLNRSRQHETTTVYLTEAEGGQLRKMPGGHLLRDLLSRLESPRGSSAERNYSMLCGIESLTGMRMGYIVHVMSCSLLL